MMKLVNVLTVNPDSVIDRAKQAGIVSLQGMVTIFAVLALLWLVIEILHRALSGDSGAKKEETVEKKEEKKPAFVKREAPKQESAPAPAAAPVAQADDGAVIAAITAAISAAMAEEGYTGGFLVVSFKRASNRRGGRA